MRLIDADNLLKIFGERLKVYEGEDDTKERYAYMAWLRSCHAIEDAPTIDAVEVVRCKDCKWYDNRYGDVCHNPRYGDGYANYQPPYVDEDYWCKDGEHKGGERSEE